MREDAIDDKGVEDNDQDWSQDGESDRQTN